MRRSSQDENKAQPVAATTRWPKVARVTKWKERIQLQKDALKEGWAKFIGKLPWRHSVTLTFDPKRRQRVGQELASREAFRWLNAIAADSRSPIGWVYATERGRSGLWHVHALITKVPENVLQHQVRSWELRNGMVNAVPVSDADGAVVYLTKNAALDGEVVLSDTIAQFRDALTANVVVRLHPEDPSISV